MIKYTKFIIDKNTPLKNVYPGNLTILISDDNAFPIHAIRVQLFDEQSSLKC